MLFAVLKNSNLPKLVLKNDSKISLCLFALINFLSFLRVQMVIVIRDKSSLSKCIIYFGYNLIYNKCCLLWHISEENSMYFKLQEIHSKRQYRFLAVYLFARTGPHYFHICSRSGQGIALKNWVKAGKLSVSTSQIIINRGHLEQACLKIFFQLMPNN